MVFFSKKYPIFPRLRWVLMGLASVVVFEIMVTAIVFAGPAKCPLNFQTCDRVGDGGKGKPHEGPRTAGGVCKIGGCTK